MFKYVTNLWSASILTMKLYFNVLIMFIWFSGSSTVAVVRSGTAPHLSERLLVYHFPQRHMYNSCRGMQQRCLS
jgi:hypothetical protein